MLKSRTVICETETQLLLHLERCQTGNRKEYAASPVYCCRPNQQRKGLCYSPFSLTLHYRVKKKKKNIFKVFNFLKALICGPNTKTTMEKRHAEENEPSAKRAKLDPDCGRLLFCGTTEWERVLNPMAMEKQFKHSRNNVYEPQRISVLKDVRIRHLGSGLEAGHCVVVDENGQAWSWGNNKFGQLGHGDTQNRRIPTPISGTGPDGEAIVEASLGKNHTVLLTDKGEVLTCGLNEDGRCGKGEMITKEDSKLPVEICNKENILTPEKINYNGPPVVQICAGTDFTILRDVTGSVWSFGSQEFGQCGTGTDGSYNASSNSISMRFVGISVPFNITKAVEKDPKTKKHKDIKMENIKMISAGAHHCAAVDAVGCVYTWGCGSYGRLGLGDTKDALCPTFVSYLDHPRGKVSSVYCGNMMTLMPTPSAGTMYMAGLLNHLHQEANMTPKQYYGILDIGGLKDIGFWQKGFTCVTKEGCVAVTNSDKTFGELGMGEMFRSQGPLKKLKSLEYANILKVGTGIHQALYIIRDTEEEDLEEYDILDQTKMEYNK